MKCNFGVAIVKNMSYIRAKRAKNYDFEMKNYMTPPLDKSPPSGGNNERSLTMTKNLRNRIYE